MRTWITLLCCILFLTGCAASTGQQAVHQKKHHSQFASADAKNVHDFLIRYQSVIAGEDAKAIVRLYADGARMVPYLVENKRTLTKKDLETRLADIIRLQRQAAMRLTFREPMDIKVSGGGERANVQALADLTWQDRGVAHQQALDCYFRLERINYLWKIRESHQAAASPGQTVSGQTATPAVQKPQGDHQFDDTPQRPIVPTDKPAQPLF